MKCRYRNENSGISSDVALARPIKSVDNERRLKGFLESNREELDINKRLALSNITDGLNIPDDMTKQRPKPWR